LRHSVMSNTRLTPRRYSLLFVSFTVSAIILRIDQNAWH
jgi:hypothetical protein